VKRVCLVEEHLDASPVEVLAAIMVRMQTFVVPTKDVSSVEEYSDASPVEALVAVVSRMLSFAILMNHVPFVVEYSDASREEQFAAGTVFVGPTSIVLVISVITNELMRQ
jgi:hypothetical protein